MSYNTQCTLPTRDQGKAPTIFEVSQDGRKLGELCVRKGSIEWVERHKASQKRYPFTWDEFSKHMKKKNNKKNT